MRLRYVPEAKDLIHSNPNYILDIQEDSVIDVKSLFENDFPVHIEIGMGKGQFIYSMAKQNPTINYIGIEKFDSVIVRALEKVLEAPLKNLMLFRMDAKHLQSVFQKHSIQRIYLNFSDPWPKDRHGKRRLTHHNFLKSYEYLLSKSATIELKTDNEKLFDFSYEEMKDYPMNILFYTKNLHQENIDNIMTEFEERFSKLGNNIYKITAQFKEEQ